MIKNLKRYPVNPSDFRYSNAVKRLQECTSEHISKNEHSGIEVSPIQMINAQSLGSFVTLSHLIYLAVALGLVILKSKKSFIIIMIM